MSNQCRAADETLALNVSSFSLRYFSDPASAVALMSPTGTSNTVLINITMSDVAAGESVTYTGTMRVSRIN